MGALVLNPLYSIGMGPLTDKPSKLICNLCHVNHHTCHMGRVVVPSFPKFHFSYTPKQGTTTPPNNRQRGEKLKAEIKGKKENSLVVRKRHFPSFYIIIHTNHPFP